jgi:hypothetical protein
MKMTCLLPLALAPVMVACAVEMESDADSDQLRAADGLDGAGLGTVQRALCAPPPTPPPYDVHWTLSDTNLSDAAYVDPGNAECDDYVVSARYVEKMEVTIVDQADTAEKCVGTTLYVRKYLKSPINGSWSADGVDTVTGVWTHEGCRLPKNVWNAYTTSDARIQITSRRTYTSGQFGVTLRGLPFVVRATKYEPSVPS